jgi:hypothetical protein
MWPIDCARRAIDLIAYAAAQVNAQLAQASPPPKCRRDGGLDPDRAPRIITSFGQTGGPAAIARIRPDPASDGPLIDMPPNKNHKPPRFDTWLGPRMGLGCAQPASVAELADARALGARELKSSSGFESPHSYHSAFVAAANAPRHLWTTFRSIGSRDRSRLPR